MVKSKSKKKSRGSSSSTASATSTKKRSQSSSSSSKTPRDTTVKKPKGMEGFLFSKNDIKNEKVDQKDCLSVLTWSGKGIKLDKRALDMKKVDATNFEL